MLLVGNIEPRRVDVERVRILHHELPHPQQPRLRARLVSKLARNLIPDLRQLLVAAQFLARDLGHDFFFRHAEAHVGAFAVLQAKQIVAHQRPASTRLPNLARMQRGHKKLLPDPVHLLAHNGDDLVERPVSEKKIRVNTRRQLPNVARPHEKLVAGYFGLRRRLAQCRNEEFRPTMHTWSSRWNVEFLIVND